MKNNPKQTGANSSPETRAIPRHIPRGLEVLVKKAAVDPKFKQLLFEKRAEAAQAIGLKLNAAEEAMLAAVPLPQLEGIVAHTRVAPKFREVFLGCAAGAMLAVVGSATFVADCTRTEGLPDVSLPRRWKNTPPTYRARPGPALGARGGDLDAVINESGSWPYSLSVGVGGGGGGTGMRADRPGVRYVGGLTGIGGSSGGMRGDYPPGTEGRFRKNKAKSGRAPQHDKLRHRVCTGSTADYPEGTGRGEPGFHPDAPDSRDAWRVSYRSAAGMQDYINKRLPGIRNAYDAAIENNPALGGGKIVVRFAVAPDGRVANVEIAEDTFGDATLRGLILSRVRSWRFAAGGEVDVTVEYPFVFVAEKE